MDGQRGLREEGAKRVGDEQSWFVWGRELGGGQLWNAEQAEQDGGDREVRRW
jgi:hypothetical protein